MNYSISNRQKKILTKEKIKDLNPNQLIQTKKRTIKISN